MTKDNILKVSTQEFSIHGYDGVSMNKLAAKLDINKATIYYHFKDKKSLYQAVILNLIKDNKEKIDALILEELEPKEKFEKYIQLQIEVFRLKPEVVPIALRELANLGSNLEDSIVPDFEAEVRNLSIIISGLDLKDKYKDIDMYVIHALILGTINSYYSMQMSDLKFNEMKRFAKSSDKTLDYLEEFIKNLLFDALTKG